MRSTSSGIVLCVLAVWVVAGPAANAQSSRPMNMYEQNAIKVVSDWIAAWQAKDPDKMAQYVTDDIKFRLDPSEPTMRTGRQAFLCQMRRMTGGGGGLVIKDATYEAFGDKVYTLVIQRRTDVIQQGPGGRRGGPPADGASAAGRPAGPPPELAGDVPAGAFFVVKNGKIAEWLDVALAIDITTLRNGPPPPTQGCD